MVNFTAGRIDLNPGVNIIYGANESGKSTVHAFIQSMLFGAERLRGRGAGRDAYSKYQPWEGGASYEGRMRLSYQDKNWRIVRNFYKDDSHFEVVDETSGRQEACASDDISSLIPGMQLSNYRNSISTGPAVGPAGWAVYDQYAVVYGEYGYGSYGQCGCGTGPGLSEG